MTNKVLIRLYVANLDEYFDIFIPVNELTWKIIKLIIKSVSDLTDGNFPINKNYAIVNTETGKIYEPNEVVINTDIRNTANLTLIEIK